MQLTDTGMLESPRWKSASLHAYGCWREKSAPAGSSNAAIHFNDPKVLIEVSKI